MPIVRRRRATAANPYRGAAGLRERWFVALLDADHRVIERLSPAYMTQAEALSAWVRRRDRRGRLVRELELVEVII